MVRNIFSSIEGEIRLEKLNVHRHTAFSKLFCGAGQINERDGQGAEGTCPSTLACRRKPIGGSGGHFPPEKFENLVVQRFNLAQSGRFTQMSKLLGYLNFMTN